MRGLRLVVTAEDYEQAVRFYRDVLGMAEQLSYETADGRVAILDAGLATLEIGDARHAAYIDDLEVGHRVAGHLRVALEVEDTAATAETAAAQGARLVAPPARTPWNSLNARLDAPGGLHLTLYTNDVYLRPQVPLAGSIVLADPDPGWADRGVALAAQVRAALGRTARLVAHVGSTAVPHLAAKPVVDLLLAVDDPADEQSYVGPLAALGYALHLREPDWHEHRLLKLPDPVVNLHVFGLGSPEVDRMLDFRDHLRADRRDRELYATTKQDLAAREWRTTQDYADAKSAVVRDILARAQARPPSLKDVFVVVSGSGRAALARGLAGQLGLPLVAADTVHRALLATQGAPSAEAGGDPASASAAVVLAVAAEAGGAVVQLPAGHGADLAALPGRVIEVPGGSVDTARLGRQVRQLARSHR